MRRRRRRQVVERRPSFEVHPNDIPFNANVRPDVVDDPHRAGDKITVTRSIRNDPLAQLYARHLPDGKRMIDDAQFAAGRKWQTHYEAAGIGLIIALDPLKEPVDGHGPSRADITDAQLYAFGKLSEAREVLGLDGSLLVREVLGDGLTIAEVAKRRGHSSQLAIKYYGMRFRECLEALAMAWGFAGRSRGVTQGL